MDSVLITPRELVADETTLTDRYGSFVCEPLERGYALTLGNALRRILLSSIRGAAVTSVRIAGVLHELSTIPGVLEDVTDIVLNVKGLTLRADTPGPHTVYLSYDGPRVVRAGDLVLPTGLTVLEPEQPIATLDRDGRLEMELTVSTGRGYVPADRNRAPGGSIGAIAVDSLYSPVRRVSYLITEARTGTSFVYERLTLSVWTNAAVAPRDAVGLAARILQHQLVPFEHVDEPLRTAAAAAIVEEPSPFAEHILLPVDQLALSVRASNCMESAKIRLIGDLVQRSEREILMIRNMGRKTLREIDRSLRQIGLSLGMSIPNWGQIRERGRPEAPGQSSGVIEQ